MYKELFTKDLENYLIAESENDEVNNYEEFEDQIKEIGLK